MFLLGLNKVKKLNNLFRVDKFFKGLHHWSFILYIVLEKTEFALRGLLRLKNLLKFCFNGPGIF